MISYGELLVLFHLLLQVTVVAAVFTAGAFVFFTHEVTIMGAYLAAPERDEIG